MVIFLPETLVSFQEEAERALQQGAVKDVEFSHATYQVCVADPLSQNEEWVFLQLSGKSEIQDSFCSFQQCQDVERCPHLAIAYLSLFSRFDEPLHKRFALSLWNCLGKIFEERLGGDSKNFEIKRRGFYQSHSATGKKIIELEALSLEAMEKLESLFCAKREESEETSLKFSNLAASELALWREGRPSAQLRYDLSFWSDLAKWLLQKQEKENSYTFSLQCSKRGLPNWIEVGFSDLRAGFYISEANLPLVIESLKTVRSPLKIVQQARSPVKSIEYDPIDQKLCVLLEKKESLPKEQRPSQEGISVGHWTFFPGEGFYSNEECELIERPVLYGEEIAHALSFHADWIASFLEGCQLTQEPTSLSYALTFDANWNLHLSAYLFEKGDLTRPHSWLIDEWAYVEDDGFYRIEDKPFQEVETVIPYYSVSEFISQHRSWLGQQKGFQIHVRSLEYQLDYALTQSGRLSFSKRVDKKARAAKTHDFGAWIYLQGYGFYSKSSNHFNFLIKPGVSLSREQIPLFIRMNEEELSFVPHFFAEKCPLKRMGVRIELVSKGCVALNPDYEFYAPFAGKPFQVFDEFLYMQDEGFSVIAENLLLPEKFRRPVELQGEELALFLKAEIETLYPYASFIDPRVKKIKCQALVANWVRPVSCGDRGWYTFRLFYETEGGLISVEALYRLLQKKEVFGFFDIGCIDLTDARLDWLKKISKERFEEDLLVLSTIEFMRLNAYQPIRLIQAGEESASIDLSASYLQKLTLMQTSQEAETKGLQTVLRSYQKKGLQWLWFLYLEQLSGLLCDDMGLGKTHQAMALLMSIANSLNSPSKKERALFLIVCPTSVLYHWQEKLAQFIPSLQVRSFVGSDRSLEGFHKDCDILLTSYGILRNELDLLAPISFEVAIYDEIQVAKNQASKTFAALSAIKAKMKVGLTGTPIENHLRELKALFDLVLPSYMPSEKKYREAFVRPIEKSGDPQKKELLNRLIYPFTLRRKKEEVLKELPEKIEETAYCDLTSCQAQLYCDLLEKKRVALIQELQNSEESIPYLHIFSLLSGLKQICDHPAVYLKEPDQYKNYSSGKWELLLELLREVRESGQKVVIFTQYLAMMDIIQSHLEEEQIGFASIRGATKNRKEQLKRFQEEDSCMVFVASLHAAGLGIDLTAASVVIHYDRWWNAARENQATDRVHRMGQKKGVQVFKLITKGTFEEKIDAMIRRKGALMEEVIGVDDPHILKSFSREELMDLLQATHLFHL